MCVVHAVHHGRAALCRLHTHTSRLVSGGENRCMYQWTGHWRWRCQRYCKHQTIPVGCPGELPVLEQTVRGRSSAWLVRYPANRVPIDTSADLLEQPLSESTSPVEAGEVHGNVSSSTTTSPAQSQRSGPTTGRCASVAAIAAVARPAFTILGGAGRRRGGGAHAGGSGKPGRGCS